MYSSSIPSESWNPIRPAVTTTATTVVVAVIGTILIGTGSTYDLDRADDWRHHIKPRVGFAINPTTKAGSERPDVRTVPEHLNNIRRILNPSIAELATLLAVSRQTIYKWMSSDSLPEPDKQKRIRELSGIADAFDEAGISRANSLLKMKAFAGHSLMDLIATGKNQQSHVDALINEARIMEDSYQQSGLRDSKARPSNDWKTSISIPSTSEDA